MNLGHNFSEIKYNGEVYAAIGWIPYQDMEGCRLQFNYTDFYTTKEEAQAELDKLIDVPKGIKVSSYSLE